MWADNETSQDYLGFRVHADLLRSIVTDPKLLPVTVGVFADWGGGKTSLMKMLEASLQPESWPEGSPERAQCEKIACLYFNGWLFEGYDDAKSAILSSVLVALGEHKRFGPHVRDRCVSLLKSVNWMRVASLGLKHVAIPAIAAFATGGASLVPAFMGSLGELLPWKRTAAQSTSATGKEEAEEALNWEELLQEDQSPAGPLDVRTFRENFAAMLEDSSIESLVVLVDDLDRCSPERIIENLEAVKLFLNVERTAFVVGADPRIVKHANAWKYAERGVGEEEEESPSTIVTDYLEKLIQCPYRLPRLSPAEIETYMTLLFCQLHLSDNLFRGMLSACDEQRNKNRYSVFGYGAVEQCLKGSGCPEPDSELLASLAFCAAAAPLITEGLKGNPRQVKRFLNGFVLRKQLAKIAQLTNIQDAVLVKLMILEYSEEKRFRQLFEWHVAQEGQPQEIVGLEKALREPHGNPANEEGAKEVHSEWTSSAIRRWIAMDPPLAGVDLRDYFWVARDRLQTSLSGVSMVSPVVRRVFESLIAESPAKRSAGATSALDLNQEEREALFKLLEQHTKTNPTAKTGYDAYRVLIEQKLSGAADEFVRTLQLVPVDAIPPAVGMDLQTLSQSNSDLASVLQPALERIRSSDTRAGRAAKEGGTARRK